ncbi:hypothetical protein GCM10009743_65630 [Kribbella swartbergensis]
MEGEREMAERVGGISVPVEALIWLRVAYPDQIRGCHMDEVSEVLA